MYNGKLRASSSERPGSRFCRVALVVYIHKDSMQHKAQNYMRCAPHRRDFVFWACILEVRADRADRVCVSKSGTDQWVQNDVFS